MLLPEHDSLVRSFNACDWRIHGENGVKLLAFGNWRARSACLRRDSDKEE